MMSHLNEVVSDILDHSPHPESEAGDLLNYFQNRFGWSGFVLERQDVNDHVGRPLTDDEWAKVTSSEAWKAISPVFLEASSEYIEQALAEAGVS